MNNYIIIIQKYVRKHLILRKKYPYKYIQYYYNKFLKEKGCKLPFLNSSFGKALEFLYINIKKEQNIDNIRDYVKKNTNCKLSGTSDSLQIRHLGLQYGYNILKGDDMCLYNNKNISKSCYCLLNLNKTYPNFYREKRTEKVSIISWIGIKRSYENKCVNCGSIENQPMRWNSNKKTVLQYGHKDPRKHLTMNNVIPQCSICNQQYKNKAIFNDHGFIIEFNKDGF